MNAIRHNHSLNKRNRFPPGTLGSELVFVAATVPDEDADRRPGDPTPAEIRTACEQIQERWKTLDCHSCRGGRGHNEWTVPVITEVSRNARSHKDRR
jgi:hypothetical protein